MTDDEICRLSDDELELALRLNRRIANGEYLGRERRPGRRYYLWCDRQKEAKELLPRLEGELKERHPEKPVTLESILAEYHAERNHQRGVS